MLREAGLDLTCPFLELGRAIPGHPEYLCGSDEERSTELAHFIVQAERYDCIWFGRGGFGATRILQKWSDPTALPFPVTVGRGRLMGYSDITALFAMLRLLDMDLECIHGPILCEYPFHPRPKIILEALKGIACPIPVSNSCDSEFQGVIWGGNLTVLASLSGTPWHSPPSSDAIFLEDIGEAPYRLDRHLTQLVNSGFFQHTKRVYLGTFVDCGEADTVLPNLRNRCLELGLEILGELPVGHHRENYPLFLSRPYRLNTETKILEPQGEATDQTKRSA